MASGCFAHAPTPRPTPADALASLPERQALALIDNWLQDARLTPQSGWAVELPQRGGLRIDIRLDKTRVGIEWVSEADRLRYGPVLPPPDPDGQLRVVQGNDGALVLLLDHTNYQYAPGDPKALLSRRDLYSTEDRLHRDVQDFIAYVKSQYAL